MGKSGTYLSNKTKKPRHVFLVLVKAVIKLYQEWKEESRSKCFSGSNQDISGLQDHEFQTRFPEAPAFLYQIRLGDEKLEVRRSHRNVESQVHLRLALKYSIIYYTFFFCLHLVVNC